MVKVACKISLLLKYKICIRKKHPKRSSRKNKENTLKTFKLSTFIYCLYIFYNFSLFQYCTLYIIILLI